MNTIKVVARVWVKEMNIFYLNETKNSLSFLFLSAHVVRNIEWHNQSFNSDIINIDVSCRFSFRFILTLQPS